MRRRRRCPGKNEKKWNKAGPQGAVKKRFADVRAVAHCDREGAACPRLVRARRARLGDRRGRRRHEAVRTSATGDALNPPIRSGNTSVIGDGSGHRESGSELLPGFGDWRFGCGNGWFGCKNHAR
eukprot:gene16298-biopygen18782